MHIQEIFKKHPQTFSFEFFPPKTEESASALYENIKQLQPLKPSFVSVTYGAGGSTREMTHDLVIRIREEAGFETIPHLTCVCHQEHEIQEILERYAQAGVGNILALGGDPPRDLPDHDRSKDAFRYASDLVKFIHKFNDLGTHPHPKGFGVGAAAFPEGHPATPNRLEEMDYLKAKVDAGCDYLCTQLFFDNRDFYDFRERCEHAGIHVPLIAGLMPITSGKGMRKMATLAAGSRFPAPLLKAIDRCNGDEEAIKRVGVHWATEQARDLIHNGVSGIHFYTLNKSDATRKIYETLGVTDSVALAGS